MKWVVHLLAAKEECLGSSFPFNLSKYSDAHKFQFLVRNLLSTCSTPCSSLKNVWAHVDCWCWIYSILLGHLAAKRRASLLCLLSLYLQTFLFSPQIHFLNFMSLLWNPASKTTSSFPSDAINLSSHFFCFKTFTKTPQSRSVLAPHQHLSKSLPLLLLLSSSSSSSSSCLWLFPRLQSERQNILDPNKRSRAYCL